MVSEIPQTLVAVLDDNPDAVCKAKMLLGDVFKVEAPANPWNVDKALEYCLNWNNLPDVVLLDICLKRGEPEIVTSEKRTLRDLFELSKISGVILLSKLRWFLPRLPIVLWSEYWGAMLNGNERQPMPNLLQHALCFINLRETQLSLQQTLTLAHQAIIGVVLPDKFFDACKTVLDTANRIQGHFYFHPCRNLADVILPPESLKADSTSHLARLYDVWSARLLAVVNASKEQEGHNDDFVLPFNRENPRIYKSAFFRYIDYMGSKYMSSYLLRECSRVAYLTFFKLQPHPMATGECLMDSSMYPPDLLSGIQRGLCHECLSLVNSSCADGGWSLRRREAAIKLIKYMRASLDEPHAELSAEVVNER